MAPHALFVRYLLQVATQVLVHISPVVTNPYLRPFAVEGLARLAMRKSNKLIVHLANGARRSRPIQTTGKQTPVIWTKQAETITDTNTLSRRSTFRTRLIVTATLAQFLVAWKWPLSKWSVFDGYGDDDAYAWFDTGRRVLCPPTEAWSMKGITLPLLPCRWRHCCECEHLGTAWCTKDHQK